MGEADEGARSAKRKRLAAWLALALLAPLTGCVGAAVIPLLASGPLFGRHHVRAATPVPKSKAQRKTATPAAVDKPAQPAPTEASAGQPSEPPTADGEGAAPEPWQAFFAYALASEDASGNVSSGRSVLLTPNPPINMPSLRDCHKPVPAVVIDLDDGATPFNPSALGRAPAGVAEGLDKLRKAGIVVLWISQLPAARAADVAQALHASGLDPTGTDQLLLVRNPMDRKQLLREDAGEDVCIVAIAGDRRGDFDELFDYLRRPWEAFGLDAMLGNGWFMVSLLDAPPATTK
jgi:hypothetical protein